MCIRDSIIDSVAIETGRISGDNDEENRESTSDNNDSEESEID